jgi:serine/threonine protein kinase
MYRSHGDLGPEAILFFPTQSVETGADVKSIITSGQLKIACFELAFAVGSAFSGQRAYRAPEYDVEGRNTPQAGDIWSLGAVFLESVTCALTGPSGIAKFRATRMSDCSPDLFDDKYFIVFIVEKDPMSAILRAEVKQSVTKVGCSTHSNFMLRGIAETNSVSVDRDTAQAPEDIAVLLTRPRSHTKRHAGCRRAKAFRCCDMRQVFQRRCRLDQYEQHARAGSTSAPRS